MNELQSKAQSALISNCLSFFLSFFFNNIIEHLTFQFVQYVVHRVGVLQIVNYNILLLRRYME